MTSYKIIVEDMKCQNCARTIREAFADNDATATVNLARKEVIVDSDLSVEEIYKIIEDAGFTGGDLDLL